jgi:hypothetical protein
MKCHPILITAFVLTTLLGCSENQEAVSHDASSSLTATSAASSASQQEAIKAIERLGGHYYPKVDAIDLNNTKATDTDMPLVTCFPQLKSLDLIDTQVSDTGLKYVKSLTQLRELTLRGSKVTGPGLDNLAGLGQLQGLYLGGHNVTNATLEHIEGLVTLRTVWIQNTLVTDSGLEHLKGLTRLTEIMLNGTKIKGDGLKHLKGMSELGLLNLADTQVDDAALRHLYGLPRLARAFMDHSRVTEDGIKRLKAALPNLIFTPPIRDLWKAGMPMPVFITPFYNSEGPQVNVGTTFSKGLASANAESIIDVAANMQRQWDSLPIVAMYVLAIRLYDLGKKDEAAYWYYSASHRARLFKLLLSENNPQHIGATAFEATSAHEAFRQLAGQWINGYTFGDLDKAKARFKEVQSESEKRSLPKFESIYPNVHFIATALWADKNKEAVVSYFPKMLDFIDKNADDIKAKRKTAGIDGKY